MQERREKAPSSLSSLFPLWPVQVPVLFAPGLHSVHSPLACQARAVLLASVVGTLAQCGAMRDECTSYIQVSIKKSIKKLTQVFVRKKCTVKKAEENFKQHETWVLNQRTILTMVPISFVWLCRLSHSSNMTKHSRITQCVHNKPL